MIQVALDDVRISVLDAGTLWLDGGAMFGVVPKVLWQNERPPDERNRIRLAMNVLLIEEADRRILVDTGAGTNWDARSLEIYGLEPRTAAQILAPAGVAPDQIDLVVNSHLHFDHAGGNTRRDEGGRVVASFPNATYVVQRGELETARWRNERTRGSYRADDFEPLAAEGRLRAVEGELSLSRHVHLRLAPGHTPHMQIVLVRSRARVLAFLADLVPTSSHVPYPYIMGYDLEPLATLASKKRVLADAAREQWRVVFEHDATMPLGTLEEVSGRLRARPLEGA